MCISLSSHSGQLEEFGSFFPSCKVPRYVQNQTFYHSHTFKLPKLERPGSKAAQIFAWNHLNTYLKKE